MKGGKDKAAICILFSAIFLFGLPERAETSTITNDLHYGSWLYSLAVNAGDTVVWVNQWPQNAGTNYVESYGGEWKSPALNSGDSFSFTFTNAGFFAYRTKAGAGTITVVAWTGAPPALTINTPVDGSVFSWSWGTWVQASVPNPEDLAQIEYFANSNLIGTATNSPYGVGWRPAQQDQYTFVAKATDRQGGVTWSQPVNVTGRGGSPFYVWGPRLLPTGEMLFFYNAVSTAIPGYLASSDSPRFPYNVCSANNYTNSNLGWVRQPGVFVDESVRGGAVQRRFYAVIPGVRVCP